MTSTENDKTMNTLIVWSNQEECKLYLIPNSEINARREKLLLQANGNWINVSDDTEGAQFLSNAFSPKREYCFEGNPEDYCIWKDREVSTEDAALSGQNIDRVISSGFWS
jgi:hypothetical protein